MSEPIFPKGAVFADDACLNCPEPCPDKWKVPEEVKKENSYDDGPLSLVGSIKSYSRHLLVSTGNGMDWPGHVEKLENVGTVDATVKEHKKTIPGRTIVGAIDGASSLFGDSKAGTADLLLLPSLSTVSLPSSEIASSLPKFLTSPDSLEAAKKLSLTHVILVCVHMNRDSRCGKLGPAIIEALKEVVKEKGLEGKVDVFGCSHVGGHKYAGNVIVYPGGFGLFERAGLRFLFRLRLTDDRVETNRRRLVRASASASCAGDY